MGTKSVEVGDEDVFVHFPAPGINDLPKDKADALDAEITVKAIEMVDIVGRYLGWKS